MENSEKGVGKVTPSILTFLYELRVIRQQYFFFQYLVFCMEVVFLLSFCLQQAMPLADPPLMAVVQVIITKMQVFQTHVINGKMTMLIFNLLSFFFLVMAILAMLSLYSQSQLQYTSKLQRFYQKARKFYLAVFIIFEAIVVPALVLSIQNIVNRVLTEILVVSYINLPFLVLLVLLEKKRRFYQVHVLTILLTWMIANGFTPLLMGLISLRLGWLEQSRTQMKIVYYQFAIWNSFILLCKSLGQSIDSFYLLFALGISVALVLIHNENTYSLDQIPANRRLINLIEKLIDNKLLSLAEKMFINREMCRFKEELNMTEKFHLTEEERTWIQSSKQGILKDDLLFFMQLKIDFSLRRQYSHHLKMQALQCSVRFKTFNMKILYEIQKLTKEIKMQSTFQQQEKLYQLVSLTDRKFLKKGQTLNASTVISVQKETERLYEHFINIAIVMQELWTLHNSGHLTDKILRKILEKITAMQSQSQEILNRISKFNLVRHEMIVYEMVKRLNNNSYKPKEFNEYERANEEIANSEYMNYILIQQGNILDMSNRLLNDFQLTKKQAVGYCLRDIVNEQLNTYLNLHLDHLIQEEVHHQEANFILPLRISRDHPYIQPFKTKILLLPELINGIKYIIHLQKTTDLQKIPFVLYSGKSDSIVGITKNLKQYFRMESDHYLFHNYTHQIFNVDILSVYNQNKNFQTIICEFNAKKTNTTTKGSKLRQVPVILKNIKQYENSDDSLILMSIVKRQQFQRTEMTNLISEKLLFQGTNRIFIKNNNDHSYLSSHQTCVSFCRISNPYENLIDEKISKMGEFYRMSYLKCVLLLFGVIIFTILTALAIMVMQTGSYSSNIRHNYDSDILQNDKAINLYELYTQSSILYQLHTYPQEYSQVNPNFNASQLIEQYSSITSQNIKTILTSQVQTDLQSYKPTGNNATVYDIVQNSKQSIVSQSIGPMILSWPSLKHISTNQTFTSDSLINLCNFFQYFTIFCLSFISLLILAVELVSYQIQAISHEILYIYEKVDREHSQKFVEIYKVFAHQLYSSNYFRGVKSNEYLQSYKNKKNLQAIQEMSTLIYLEEQMHFDLQRQEMSTSDNVSNPQRVIGKDMKFAFVYKDSFIFLIILFLVCFLQVYLYHAHEYQKQFATMLAHSIQLHEARGNISHNAAYFMVTSLQETLPPKSRLTPQFPTDMFLQTQLTTDLPSFYNDYVTKKQGLLNTNLCALPNLNSDPLYEGMKCQDLLEGVLTIGYAETLVMYNDVVNDFIFKSMATFLGLKRSNSSYPAFLEILYVKVCLFGILTNLQNNFIEHTHRYIKIWNDRLSWLINLGWILLPLSLVLTLMLYLRIRSRCCICLKSFFILPKQYLLEMKVTKILRQRSILDYIQKLAF